MNLQKILFPNVETCRDIDMYYHFKKGCIFQPSGIVLNAGDILEGDTYFNAFSLAKWKKYTRIDNLWVSLILKGECEINLCGAYINDKNIICRKRDNLVAGTFSSEEKQPIRLQFNLNEYNECPLVYVQIKAKKETVFYGGSYFTNVEEKKLPAVKIAVGICTYHREDFIFRNLGAIDRDILSKETQLTNKIDIFISDNGGTLPLRALRKPHVFVFKNKNYGGSGGFTRCIMEVLRRKKEKAYTHILLMDDDIAFDTSIFDRLYSFLRLIKPAYKDIAIGGAMLIMSDRKRQFENGARLLSNGMLQFKNKNLNLTTIRNILANDVQQDNNYNAWCICCMPLDKIDKNNLPLPLFIHMDDVEYGVRNQFDFVNLNGICVWHPYGSNMRNTSIVYYDVRNKLISMASVGSCDLEKYAIRWLRNFRSDIFVYNYSRARIACRAIRDFLKGIDEFKKVNPIKLNKELAKYNINWVDAPLEHLRNITPVESPKKLSPEELRKKKIKMYALPANKKYIVRNCDIAGSDPYRARTLYICDMTTKKERVYKKSILKAAYCYLDCLLLEKEIKKKMKFVGLEWRVRIKELYKWDFWTQYLGI
ncbi:MAG: glycosyltransferase family 2 protein [Clostridia bacterium]|nr:glycosyltransferase family 2 protein [Clostridia bacterium]